MKIGLPEITLGLIPGAGGTIRVSRAVGKSKAMEMILTGEPISAEDALKWGLISQLHPDQATLMEAAFTLARKIASKSQVAAAFAKRAVQYSSNVGETAGMDHERSLFIASMGTEDKKEGTKAFIEKRKAKWTDS